MEIVSVAPLRLPLAGGGADVRSFATTHRVSLIAAAIGPMVRVAIQPYDDLTECSNLTVNGARIDALDMKRLAPHCWYALERFACGIPFLVTSSCGVAPGTGLGSSASFTAALVLALRTFWGAQVHTAQLAMDVLSVELAASDGVAGWQDPYVAAVGGIQLLQSQPSAWARVQAREIVPPDAALVSLAEGLALFRVGGRREAKAFLARDAASFSTPAGEQGMLGIQALVSEVHDALMRGDIGLLANAIGRHWQLKQRRAQGYEDPAVAAACCAARDSGALAWKLIGAGGSGHLLIVADRSAMGRVRAALAQVGGSELPFVIDGRGARVEVIRWR